jgi:NTE family protein
MASSKKIALVIGSGGVKCAAALGLLRVLEREGIEVELVVGCSGGSLYATTIALGWSIDKAIEETKKLWTREISQRRNRSALLRILFPKLTRFDARFGLIDDTLALERLRNAFAAYRFEDAKIPLYLTATDFTTGEQVVMHSGSLVDAIRSSIAMPYIFKPWSFEDRLLIDGYMSDPLPVGVAIKEGADIILAMGFEADHQRQVDSLTRFAFQLSSIASNNLFKANFAFHNAVHHNEIIPIMPQFKERISVFNTHKIPYVIEEGERAAEEHLPYLRQLLAVTAPAQGSG